MGLDKYFGLAVDHAGNVIPGASVSVTNYFGGHVSTLLDDDENEELDNPLTTDADGRFEFCAESGLYNITITKGDVVIQFRHVVMVGTADIPTIRRIFRNPVYSVDIHPIAVEIPHTTMYMTQRVEGDPIVSPTVQTIQTCTIS